MNTTHDIEHIVVPGTFDPVTFGHLDVISRAKRFASHVTVGVAASTSKGLHGPVFTLDERCELVKQALIEKDLASDVDVLPVEGLLVDFCHEIGASAVVKGLRAMTDFEYELQQADLNHRLAQDIESIFIMSAPEYGYLSSSVVRELASLGSDVSLFVPQCVCCALNEHFCV